MDKIKAADNIGTLEETLNTVFDLNQNTVFFPIRHHSPACSYHVQKAVELYKPDCVLIEGPHDTDPLIEFMTDEMTKPPFSIYYSYKDDEGRYACYYPFLDYSPELVSLKAALKNSIEVHFIDLPFGDLVLDERTRQKELSDKEAQDKEAQENEVQEAENAEKPDVGKTEERDVFQTKKKKSEQDQRQTYFNDYFLARSKYIETLCQKENCRDYSELWEKLFEINAKYIKTEEFVKNMTTLCYFSRVEYPAELLIEESNFIREEFMAANILEYQKKFSRILVVTGGFHTAGLIARLKSADKIKKQKTAKGESYLIPYSFQECDGLSGYDSGMPYPGYYQSVFGNLSKYSGDGEEPYSKTTILYITKLAKMLRARKENISLSEEAAAYQMTLGLCELREKAECGVYELMDGVRSAFVKGELNLSTSFVLEAANNLLRGEKMGQVGKNTPVPPIVLDFHALAKQYRMDISTAAQKTAMLDIVSRQKHREQSVFLHRLTYLDNPFAVKTSGPDYINRTNTRLIREKWDYSYTGRVNAALIEKSNLGGTIAEAVESKLSEEIKEQCHNSQEASGLLIKAGVMALFSHAQRIMDVLLETVANDFSFISLAGCIQNISFLNGVKHILRIDNLAKVTESMNLAYSRIISMIPALTAADEKEDFEIAKICKSLYQIAATGDSDSMTYKELYLDALLDLIEQKACPPAVDGAATGLLYNAGRLTLSDVLSRAGAYFSATGEILALSGRFLRGLFLTAKDVIFYDEGFLAGLDGVIKGYTYEEFLELLPDLRLSFTYFSPREISQISEKLLLILGVKSDKSQSIFSRNVPDILSYPALEERMYTLAAELDERAFVYLEDRGYLKNV